MRNKHGNQGWRDRLAGRGARITGPRSVIIGVMQESEGHLSASEIYIRAHEINPGIGLTTVYRTLDILSQAGIVQKFDFGDGTARFELSDDPDSSGHHHHHLVCRACGKIIDYTDFIKEEIEFIKKIAFSIATNLNIVKMNERNVNLIQQFQEQAENIQEKEEQMQLTLEELQYVREQNTQLQQKLKEIEGDSQENDKQ